MQIRSHSEALGVRTWTYAEGRGHNVTHSTYDTGTVTILIFYVWAPERPGRSSGLPRVGKKGKQMVGIN